MDCGTTCWTCHQQIASLNPGYHAVCLVSPSSINMVPVEAGKVTIGLVSHWPHVTDNSGISTYGLTASEKETSTPQHSVG